MEVNFNLGNFLNTIGGFFIAGLFVYFLSRLLKVKYEYWKFPKPKSAGLAALTLVFITFLATTGLILLFSQNSNSPGTTLSKPIDSLQDFLAQLISATIFIIPFVILMLKRKEPLKSAGLSKQNLKASILIAIGLLIIPVALWVWKFENVNNLGTTALTVSLFFFFLQNAVIGFYEEFVFRGYLQTRLASWLGKYPGWIIASILMAMMHISIRIAWEGFTPLGALINCLLIIPISLFLGYFMLRTGNIVGPAIIHTFANWLEIQ